MASFSTHQKQAASSGLLNLGGTKGGKSASLGENSESKRLPREMVAKLSLQGHSGKGVLYFLCFVGSATLRKPQAPNQAPSGSQKRTGRE